MNILKIIIKIIVSIILLVFSLFAVALAGTSLSNTHFVVVGIVDIIILYFIWKPKKDGEQN